MGTRRYIATSFWDDEWVQALDPSEKLLYMYLLTNPLTNIAGIYKVAVRRMSFDTGFSSDTIRGIFAKFEAAGKAYRMGEYVVLPSWPKHQNWESKDDIKTGIVKIVDSLSDGELVFVSRVGYKFPVGDILARRGLNPPPTPVEPTPTPHEPTYSILSNSILSKNLDDPENPDDSPDQKDFPTASAVALSKEQLFLTEETPEPVIVPGTALVSARSRSRSPPAKSKKNDLSPEQLALFHAAKAVFEASEKTRAIMYQDRESTARYMKHLKTLAVRCANMVLDASADFLRNILEHFSVMCGSGKLRDKVSFTPQSLITGWVWEKVIDSLPEAESPELKEFVRGLFK